MIKINDKVLSNEEVLKLLQEETGEGRMTSMVEFQLLENYQSVLRLLNSNKERVNLKKYQATFGLTNQYVRRNFTSGGSETVCYYTNAVPDGKGGFRYHITNQSGELNKVVFHNGYLQVQPGQEDLLLFMRINEQCKTNLWWEKADNRGVQLYKPERSFLYKELIPEKESELEFDDSMLELKAMSYAMDAQKIPLGRAFTMAEGYNMLDAKYKGEKAVRIFLKNRAKLNPSQFMLDIESASFEVRGKINAAFKYGILKYESPYISWTSKTMGDNRICSVPVSKDHIDYFTMWVREIDRSGVLDEINRLMEKEVIKDHVETPDSGSAYDQLLKQLGVTSLEEATKLINSGKATKAEKVEGDVGKVIENFATYTEETLKLLTFETLQQVAKELKMKGWHLYHEQRLIQELVKLLPEEVTA